MKNIGIQKGLSSIKDYLTKQGYQTYEIDTSQKNDVNFINQFDAVVLTGIDNNFLGTQTTSTQIPFIEASGKSPQEIENAIEQQI